MSAASLGTPPPVGLYLHFPFCLSICPYCDFVVYAGRAARGPTNRVDGLVDALVIELGLRAAPASLGSVYLGGGTPSLMSAAQVARLLAAADEAFGIDSGAEITMEVNPGRGEQGDLAGFRAAGVNRLSIGAQSLAADELRRLGRRHTADDVSATVALARDAGFDNLSLDILYDVPGQTIESWRSTVEAVVALAPEHISAYALTLDDEVSGADHLPARRGATGWRTRARTEQDQDRAADMYELADDLFAAAGLTWYEISNWSRAGCESRHNLAYWRGSAWEAAGPGAHAFDGARTRRWNAALLEGYISALAQGRLPPGGVETLDGDAALTESVILQLRTRHGSAAVPEPAWARENGLSDAAEGGGWRLTRRGRLLSNEVFVRLMSKPEATAQIGATTNW